MHKAVNVGIMSAVNNGRLREDRISPEPVEWVTNSSINPLKGPNFRFVLSDYFTQFYAASSEALCEQIS